MKAIEIPAHCRTGVNLELLEESIKKHRVRAYITMTNCQNPLGYVLTDDKKRALVDLLARHEIPLIEDDVYGDLAFGTNRPRTAKSFDRRDLVMLCGSFSKTVAPGLRIGWVQGGRYHAEIERLKLLTNLASASLPQLAIAEFMQSGGYDRHIRSLRIAFEQQVQMVSQAVTKYFPAGTCVSRPAGGYVLWVELPKNTDSVSVYRAALAEGISISPGPIFSPSGKFRNYIRLNCGRTWSEELDRAVLKLGRLCEAR
jgi:DNA-binding transcriptional MocR family regulator